MRYFTISKHSAMPLTLVELRDKAPKLNRADKGDFICFHSVALDGEDAEIGAQATIDMLDEFMGQRTRAPGLYQAPAQDVVEVYEAILNNAPSPKPKHHWAVRILAALGIVPALLWMCGVGVWFMILWLIICAFRSQSGLLTMAETGVIFTIFDTRPIIKRLGDIASGK